MQTTKQMLRGRVAHTHDTGQHTRAFKRAWGNPENVLNVGCGSDQRPGWTNMDLYAPGADVKHDITQFPWPFMDEAFDGVYLSHIIEHLRPVTNGQDTLGLVLQECQRVLKPGGRIYIATPYAGSDTDLGNITHYRRFGPHSFHFLSDDSKSTLVQQFGLKLRVLHSGVARAIKIGSFNTIYHGRKYLGRPLNIGRKEGLFWVLVKP